MKSGYKTTEFWLTLLAQVFGGVVLFGVLSGVEADSIVEAVGLLVKAVTGLFVALAPLIAYIKNRAAVKSAAEYAKD